MTMCTHEFPAIREGGGYSTDGGGRKALCIVNGSPTCFRRTLFIYSYLFLFTVYTRV